MPVHQASTCLLAGAAARQAARQSEWYVCLITCSL